MCVDVSRVQLSYAIINSLIRETEVQIKTKKNESVLFVVSRICSFSLVLFISFHVSKVQTLAVAMFTA